MNTLDKAVRIFFWFILLPLALFCIIFPACWKIHEMRQDHLVPAWVKQAHKKHGIGISIEERGKHCFYRDGKRVKL